MLTGVVVAPITSNVREIPTEVALGESEGLSVECAASLDNLQMVRRATLTERVGELAFAKSQMCSALSALADC